ncbi:MAG: hypothetical protein CMI60_05325 [Parvibaculum sp.]|nr:hypothetical protein [Parvibaculum sp.]
MKDQTFTGYANNAPILKQDYSQKNQTQQNNNATFTQDNFIGIYKSVFPEGYCEHLISEFNRLKGQGAGFDRIKGENASNHVKSDYSIGMNIRSHTMLPFNNIDAVDMFFGGLQGCYEKYLEKYSVLCTEQVNADTMKMQCTSPGGGYHVWHGEQGNGVHANRALVYSLYLNTIPQESAGETEFLYHQLRVSPEKNMMILWPAAFTHAHRGNTLFGNQDKYIVTGWFYYE